MTAARHLSHIYICCGSDSAFVLDPLGQFKAVLTLQAGAIRNTSEVLVGTWQANLSWEREQDSCDHVRVLSKLERLGNGEVTLIFLVG